MSSQKYSRDYLINLPIQMRKQAVETLCRDKINWILSEARNGKTSCIVSVPEQPAQQRGLINMQTMYQAPPSKDELADFLMETFPDCKISYEETWVDVSPGKKELKKGFHVDWS